jgi:hypothetical protein
VVVFAAGCQTTVSKPVTKDLSFAQLPLLTFDLARIDIVDAYQPPLGPPNVDHDFPTPPNVALKGWVQDRLRVNGGSGVLRVIIEDASARAVRLETNADLEGLITTEQNERLDARMLVTLEIADDEGVVRAHTTAEAKRSRTLPEGLTLDERDKLYNSITEALLNDYNATQEQSIRQYFGEYLR